MTRVIVTTTINPPTKAVRLFDSMPGWQLVVVGDLKTPGDYRLEAGRYIGPEEQEKIDKRLSELIGWNCIQRRTYGFLVAHERGAEVVAVVDDDNVPCDGWGTELLVDREVEANVFTTGLPAFDPVGATNYPHLWHRGYPLQLLSKRDYSTSVREVVRADIQADFWDGDPDVDAICRMQYDPQCRFDAAVFPIAAGVMSPFNSQNTFLAGRWLRDYFLFPHVGRMDDIWAGYHVQAKGAKVVFGKPSVVQERNVHDPVVDMRQEYLGYENNLAIVEALAEDADALFRFLPRRTREAFDRYRSHF